MGSFFLPSEIAKLILGYLIDERCNKSKQAFLEESPHLKEYRLMFAKGKMFLPTLNLYSLYDILEEYGELRILVKKFASVYPWLEIKKSENLVTAFNRILTRCISALKESKISEDTHIESREADGNRNGCKKFQTISSGDCPEEGVSIDINAIDINSGSSRNSFDLSGIVIDPESEVEDSINRSTEPSGLKIITQEDYLGSYKTQRAFTRKYDTLKGLNDYGKRQYEMPPDSFSWVHYNHLVTNRTVQENVVERIQKTSALPSIQKDDTAMTEKCDMLAQTCIIDISEEPTLPLMCNKKPKNSARRGQKKSEVMREDVQHNKQVSSADPKGLHEDITEMLSSCNGNLSTSRRKLQTRGKLRSRKARDSQHCKEGQPILSHPKNARPGWLSQKVGSSFKPEQSAQVSPIPSDCDSDDLDVSQGIIEKPSQQIVKIYGTEPCVSPELSYTVNIVDPKSSNVRIVDTVSLSKHDRRKAICAGKNVAKAVPHASSPKRPNRGMAKERRKNRVEVGRCTDVSTVSSVEDVTLASRRHTSADHLDNEVIEVDRSDRDSVTTNVKVPKRSLSRTKDAGRTDVTRKKPFIQLQK